MSKGSKQRPGKGYGEGFDRIFGTQPKKETGRFIIDSDTKKVVRAETLERNRRSSVIGDIEPFVSPIDGSVISSRSTLREHHKKHGTTDIRDYSQEHFEKAHQQRNDSVNGNTKADKADRIDRIRHAIDRRR